MKATDHIIVLDLDSTLIYTAEEDDVNNLMSIIRKKKPSEYYSFSIDYDKMMEGVFRPYLREFMQFCNQYFKEIIVYTAGTADYADLIVDQIVVKTGVNIGKVYSRDDCLRFVTNNIYNTIDDIRKPLSLLLKDYEIEHLFLVDDKVCNFRFNPRNGIHIPAYIPTNFEDAMNDDYLLRLYKWFDSFKVRTIHDVRLLPKDFIFGMQIGTDTF